MEQFSLEKYLADPTRKVVTRDGRDVRIICTDKQTRKGFPIVALVCEDIEDEEVEVPATYTANGEYSTFDIESDMDLFFAAQKQSRWVFLYKMRFDDGSVVVYSSKAYSSKEIALSKMDDNCFGLTEITWEE